MSICGERDDAPTHPVYTLGVRYLRRDGRRVVSMDEGTSTVGELWSWDEANEEINQADRRAELDAEIEADEERERRLDARWDD